jgi:hypothetical protein
MKRQAIASQEEPEQKKFEIPSEGEKKFQITDVITVDDKLGAMLKLDGDTVAVKCEVAEGEEVGREILHRINLDDQADNFWATRALLKVIGLEYKGEITIDTDEFIGRQFYCEVKHNKSKDGTKTYANLGKYNYEKPVEQFTTPGAPLTEGWDD